MFRVINSVEELLNPIQFVHVTRRCRSVPVTLRLLIPGILDRPPRAGLKTLLRQGQVDISYGTVRCTYRIHTRRRHLGGIVRSWLAYHPGIRNSVVPRYSCAADLPAALVACNLRGCVTRSPNIFFPRARPRPIPLGGRTPADCFLFRRHSAAIVRERVRLRTVLFLLLRVLFARINVFWIVSLVFERFVLLRWKRRDLDSFRF